MYDFDTHQFYDSFDSKFCLFASIPRIKPIRNDEDIDFLNTMLFANPFKDPNMGQRLKEELSLALHGGYYQRRQFIFFFFNL